MRKNDIGIIGLAVMGRSLALNMADHKFKVAGYNRSYEVSEKMMEAYPDENFHAYKTLNEFINSLSSPRKIMLMVQAGKAVDQVIEQLLPLLDQGDMILDGGNSYFQDTIAREKELKEKGIYFFGVGVSGGEEGARFGPSIMPGGSIEQYESIRPILESIAAKAEDGTPCCTYIGDNGAGHYVKMVHNGIEYADMQIIAEAYLILKHIGHFTNDELSKIFKDYNQGELNSFLIQITKDIFSEKDEQDTGYLVDKIKDSSKQKGTGKWTSEEALRLDVNASMISAAFYSRVMSSDNNRDDAIQRFNFYKEGLSVDKKELVQQVQEGMYAAKIIAYAQGFDLLKNAASQYHWVLEFEKIAPIFRAGCIIRAAFLNEITRAYQENSQLPHLLFDDYFEKCIINYENSLRECCVYGMRAGLPVPSMSQAITYLDMLRAPHVGANLIQAQRDYFGAHTFQRKDMEGSFHHEWGKLHE